MGSVNPTFSATAAEAKLVSPAVPVRGAGLSIALGQAGGGDARGAAAVAEGGRGGRPQLVIVACDIDAEAPTGDDLSYAQGVAQAETLEIFWRAPEGEHPALDLLDVGQPALGHKCARDRLQAPALRQVGVWVQAQGAGPVSTVERLLRVQAGQDSLPVIGPGVGCVVDHDITDIARGDLGHERMGDEASYICTQGGVVWVARPRSKASTSLQRRATLGATGSSA